MQISGRLIIVVIFALAIAMSGGAWLYQYSYSRHSAEFWGPAGRLVVKSPELQLLELAATPAGDGDEGEAEANLTNQAAGRNVVDHHDLRKKPGLIHLRHVFTQDGNFAWDERSVEPVDGGKREWAYALRFVDGEAEQIVLFTRDFQLMGKLSADGATVEVLPCARLAGAVTTYLRDVGALQRDSDREVPSP